MKTLALRARVFIHCFLVFGYPSETLALGVQTTILSSLIARHGLMKTHDYMTRNDLFLYEPESLHLTKDRFAWIILSYVILRWT